MLLLCMCMEAASNAYLAFALALHGCGQVKQLVMGFDGLGTDQTWHLDAWLVDMRPCHVDLLLILGGFRPPKRQQCAFLSKLEVLPES